MARYSKIFFVFIILVLSLWLIPWFYHFMTAQPIRNPFTLYSCIIDDFACLDYIKEALTEKYWPRTA